MIFRYKVRAIYRLEGVISAVFCVSFIQLPINPILQICQMIELDEIYQTVYDLIR